MQNEENIPIHPTHHRKNMLWLFFVPIVFGCFAFLNYRTGSNFDELLKTLSVAGMAGAFVVFIATLFIRTRFACCPECKRKMKNTISLTIDNSEWEVFECNQCDKKWRIPGVSTD